MTHPPQSIAIRPVVAEDRVALAGVFQKSFAGPPWNEQWSEETTLAVLGEWLLMPQFFGLIAVAGTQPVGFVFGRFETWDKTRLFYIKELCILPEMQRLGIGSALANALQTEMKKRQVGSLYLLTLKDSSAAAFYAANGFSQSNRTALRNT